VTLANDNADKTLDKTGVYTPSEGCSVVDVLVIGGGGGGGMMALHTTAGSAWGAFYAGGGGGGGGVLAILGLSVSNSHISVGFTEPFAFTVDTSDGEAPEGPFSVSGTLLDNLSEPAPLTLVLYRKHALAMDAQGRVREGFGGLPVAVQSVMSNAGSYSIQGLTRGMFLLVARLSAQPTGTGPLASLAQSYWYAEDDGRPKPFEIAGASVSGVDVTIG